MFVLPKRRARRIGRPSASSVWRTRAAGFAALLLAGCGAAKSPPPSVKQGTAHEGGGTTAVSAEVVAAPVPLRRLTNEEYNNTVRDLLGDTSRPADAFAPDEAVGGF